LSDIEHPPNYNSDLLLKDFQINEIMFPCVEEDSLKDFSYDDNLEQLLKGKKKPNNYVFCSSQYIDNQSKIVE